MNFYVKCLIWEAIALIILDTITTFYGFSLGLEEKNSITLQFISLFGNFGVIIAAITKIGILVFPYMMFRRPIKQKELRAIKIKVYEILYATVLISAGLSALSSSIKNLAALGSSIL